jgi:hypothetical protein
MQVRAEISLDVSFVELKDIPRGNPYAPMKILLPI